MKMKNIYKFFAFAAVSMLAVGCHDTWDDLKADNYTEESLTSPTDIGPVTMTIEGFKDAYSNLFRQSNSFQKIEEDLIIEGVVIANDKGGNLYQSVILGQLRDVYDEQGVYQGEMVDPTTCIQLALKNTCLYPYFQVGQKMKVNLKDLYIGCYSYLPRIGQPYYTSAGNLRLGPALLQMCKTNVYFEGKPSDNINKVIVYPTLKDRNEFLQSRNQAYYNCPALVEVEGYFQLNDTTKHLADYEEHDAGYGVDRDFMVDNTLITVRTSTQNEVSYIQLPPISQRVRLTGILTYYSGWQLQILDKDHFELIDETEN